MRVFIAVLFILFSSSLCSAQEIDSCLFCKSYAQSLFQDTKHILTIPGQYDAEKWLIFSGAVSSVFVLSAFDEEIHRHLEGARNNATDAVADFVNPFGFQAANAIMAGFYLHGALFKNQKSKVVALDAISSTLISVGLVTALVKVSTGRSRPRANQGAYHLEPLELDGHTSFPSGHTAQAFTLAAVLSRHFPRKAVRIPAYSVAALVGFSRMNDNEHWASDVLAGALIGTLIGNEVVSLRHRREASASNIRLAIVPLQDSRGKSLNLMLQF